ncbi:unnamed protein product [Linum trigynum]|uniref:Cytochrome P450 724B1 n=2 Tax=Linum trigynum TaxID=586398 RepID=A0AAV2CP97_9ROSI
MDMMPLDLPTLFPLILALLATALLLLRRQKHPKNGCCNVPKGTMGWPFIGETLEFLSPHRSNSIGTFLQQRCSRYGKVFKSHLFGSPAIVSCDNEFNMFILQNEGKLFQASYPKAMQGILGQYSLLIVSGEHHRKLRGIAVSFSAMSKSSPVFHSRIEKLAFSMFESWRGRREISFLEEMKKFTLSLMVKTVLSIDPEEPVAMRFLQDFRTYMKGFISLPLNVPGSAYAKAVKARARLSRTVKEIIKQREMTTTTPAPARTCSNDGNCGDGITTTSSGEENGDFLEVILSKHSSIRQMNDDEKVSSVLDIVLGGYETTSTLISLIVYFLHRSPAALLAFKEEHEAIRRNKGKGQPLGWEDYQKMDFTRNVTKEAVRCGNLVKFLHRKALQDVEFKGHLIPRGWKVLPVLAGPNLDPSLHHDHLQFNPWRWTEDKEIGKKTMGYGGGPRVCPGSDLAKVMVAFFLHHLVLTYRWKVKEDEYPIAYPYVEFRNGLQVEIEPVESHV